MRTPPTSARATASPSSTPASTTTTRRWAADSARGTRSSPAGTSSTTTPTRWTTTGTAPSSPARSPRATQPTSGVAPGANLIALKVLAADGSGTYGNVQAALDWVVANRAKYNIVAINLSLGAGNYTTNPYTFLDPDFSNLTSNGVFIAVAAGNSFYENNSAVGLAYPAVDPDVVSVGAVYNGSYGSMAWASGARDTNTAPDHIASFSQRGPGLDILAPGAMITSTYLNNTFQAMAGTSMATPVITGAAVLIRQVLDAKHRTANEGTILGIMQKTGVTDVDNLSADDNVVNTGLSFERINLEAALSSLGQPVLAPVLAPIANQTVSRRRHAEPPALSGSDPGEPAAHLLPATVTGTAASQAWPQLEQVCSA